jgi:hypothetical protein
MIQRAVDRREHAPAEDAEGSAPKRGPIESAWLVLASERTTSLLVIALAAFVAITAFVPQGPEALELAREPGAAVMHRLAEWGLTDLFSSSWLYALGALLAANLLAMALSSLSARRREELAKIPARAPLDAELSASEPEHAPGTLRDLFRAGFGMPVREEVDGSRVTMVFETSRAGRLAPMATHLGLIVLVLGAGLVGRPLDAARAIGRARLEVKDTSSGKIGVFDMVAGESFQFFRWPSRYTLRGYVPAFEGMGPAVRISRVDPEQRSEDFWVFQRAPEGFDERHRKGEVAIRARSMGLHAPPGLGMSSSPGAILLLAGFGMLVFGAFAGRRPEGRLWVEADGDRVRVAGVPRMRDDRAFGKLFDRWRLLATSVLVEN